MTVGPLTQTFSFATAALLARARGTALPAAIDTAADDQVSLGFVAVGEAVVAVGEGRPADAVVAVERWMTHVPNIVLADDSHVMWPAMVEVALAAGDLECAERLLAPVATAPTTQVSPALGAQLLRLTGRVGAARGDDPVVVEDHFRRGISALDAFGAVGERAAAQEEAGPVCSTRGGPTRQRRCWRRPDRRTARSAPSAGWPGWTPSPKHRLRRRPDSPRTSSLSNAAADPGHSQGGQPRRVRRIISGPSGVRGTMVVVRRFRRSCSAPNVR